MNLFTLFRGCLLILAGSSAGLELNISIRDIVERDGAQKLATWGPILWKSPPNHAILVQLLECPWADLGEFLRPSEDAETFEALKLIATEARYKNIRDRLLTAENVANNADFLRWAVRDGNYVPKDSLASSKVPVGSMETFTIITDALSNIPEQRNKATSLGNIYDFLFEIRDPGQFQECYSRIKNLGGPTLFVNALSSWDRVRGVSDELFEEVVIKALKEDTTVFTPSRLLIYLARSSRIPEEGNRRYRKYCMLKDLLLLGQAEPEWNLLLEGARNPKSDLEAMRTAAQRLVENRVRVEGAMTPSLSMSILCIYAPVFQKARSISPPQIIKIKIIEELHDEIKIKLLLKGVSIPGMQVDMKLDIPAAQVDMKLNIPTVQVHRQLNIPAMQVDMKLDIPAVQVHRKLNIPAMQVYRELNIPVVQVSKELKPFSCVSELSKALNLDSLVKEFYKNSGISTDLPLHTVLSCIEDAEGQRKVYLRSQVEIPCEDRELVDEKDTPLTVDEQVELLLREDLGDLTVLRKKWRFSKPQPLNDGKYAEMAHDLAFNYLEAALAEPGYLWDAEYKITCQENTIKRWNAFFKALPVLLLRGKRLPKIGRLFRKDIFGNYTLREAETLARDWDEESDSMRTLWEELRYAFEDTALSWGSKLIELIVQEGDLVDDGQTYE